MRATRTVLASALALGLAAPAAGCRGGAAAPTPVVLTIGLQGGAGAAMHGVDAVVALPAGAVVASDPATGRVAAASLRLGAGAAAGVVEARFIPHRKAPSLRLLVASGAPLVAGPLVHVTLTVPGGVPSASAFEVASSVVAGDGGATVGNAGLLIAGVEAAR